MDEVREARRWSRQGRVNRAPTGGDATQPWEGRWIYGMGSGARPSTNRDPAHYDVRDIPPDRTAEEIETIILHITSNPIFSGDDLPRESEDSVRTDHHEVDDIICHLQVLSDGTVVYTHDLGFILNGASKRKGVDIEFHGSFPSWRGGPRSEAERPSLLAIRQGRALVKALKAALPNLRFIHPHGQVQDEDARPDKFDTCPGADIWMNVGMWSVRHLGLECGRTDGRPNRGISPLQMNPRYERDP